MSKPAARIGDMHTCPKVTPGTGTPHVGGQIIGPGCASVLIEGMPAATEGDVCNCLGEPDKITGGSSGVFIGGKPAARLGDRCDHGGTVTSGCGSVLIGEGGRCGFLKEKKAEEWVGPSQEEKERIINRAIKECIALLERKFALLERKDSKTMDDFKIWFGCMDEERVEIILNRIQRALAIGKLLTVNNFDDIADDFARTNYVALVNVWDECHTIYLGDRFWKINNDVGQSRADTLIHELSHFLDIGHTLDFDYDSEQCLYLSENHPTRAFYNADSFMYFIKA